MEERRADWAKRADGGVGYGAELDDGFGRCGAQRGKGGVEEPAGQSAESRVGVRVGLDG
jgi:hypothetical protein